MHVAIMKTNGGPHPAEKWALTTVGEIMQAVFGIRDAETATQRKLEIALLDALERQHGAVQRHERGKIAELGVGRLAQPLDPSEHLGAPIEDMVDATRAVGQVEMADPDNPGKTKMVDVAAHFARPEVQEQLRLLIGRHFATSMDVERSWHADRNPDDPVAKAYRAARRDHGGHRAHEHALAAMPASA